MKNFAFLLLSCCLLFGTSCSSVLQKSISKEQWAKTDRVSYSFTDASLPPEYHRSYTIDINSDSVCISVTCYGDVLLRESYPFTKEKFDAVKTELAEQGFKLNKHAQESTETGGTADAVAFYIGDQCYFTGSVYAGMGSLSVKNGPINKAFVKALPEDVDAIIASTRRQSAQQRPPERKPVTKEQWAQTDRVYYRFTDSSTPPECHRSYDIGISSDSVCISVNSYGYELLRKSYPFTKEQFESVKAELAEQGFALQKQPDEPLVTGGTTDAVAFYIGDRCYFSGSVYAGIGTLVVKQGPINKAFVKAVPEDVDALIESTRSY